MNVNLYIIEDYENKTAFRPEKNKPNQTQSRKGFFYAQETHITQITQI